MMERKEIVVDNKAYEALAIFHNDETDKDYVVYTDLNNIKEGITLSCVICKEENDDLIPIKIHEDKDKEIAVSLIRTVMQEIDNYIRK